MKKEIIKYDEQFKRTVVEMLESGELKSFQSAKKLFKIGGSMTIQKFLKQLHREDLLPKTKVRHLIDEIDDIKERDPNLYEKILIRMQ